MSWMDILKEEDPDFMQEQGLFLGVIELLQWMEQNNIKNGKELLRQYSVLLATYSQNDNWKKQGATEKLEQDLRNLANAVTKEITWNGETYRLRDRYIEILNHTIQERLQ